MESVKEMIDLCARLDLVAQDVSGRFKGIVGRTQGLCRVWRPIIRMMGSQDIEHETETGIVLQLIGIVL